MADSLYKSKDLGRNLLLFEGLKFARTISPTDIDMMLESRGEVMVFGEFKHVNSGKLTKGQQILFENLIDNLRIPAIAFLAIHDAEGDVIAADCNIKGVYYNEEFKSTGSGKWLSKKWKEMSVKQFLNLIARKYKFHIDYDTTEDPHDS